MREELRTIVDMTAEERIQHTREILAGITPEDNLTGGGEFLRCEIVRDDDWKHGRQSSRVETGKARNIVRSYLGDYERFAGDEKRRGQKAPGILFVSVEDYLNACFNDKFHTGVVIPDAAWDMLIAEERARQDTL